MIRTFLILALLFTQTLSAQKKYKWSDEQYQKITLIFTNDVHGGVTLTEASFINPDFPPIIGGGPSAARYINLYRDKAKEKNWGVLLLDQGDWYQGTLVGTRSAGSAVFEYMNMINYDAACIGNHDFDLGKDNVIKLSEQARFPILAANIIDKSTNDIAGFVKPYLIKEMNGIKIGIIGLATRSTVVMSYPKHIEGLDFLPEIPVARKYVKKLREEEKCDFIILSTHSWLDYNPAEGYANLLKDIANKKDFESGTATAIEIAHFVEGIDLILGGHVHKGHDKPWEEPDNHTLIIQSYANSSSSLGQINFYFDRSTKIFTGYDFDNDKGAMMTLFSDEFWPDQAFYDSIVVLQKQYEKGFDDVLGVSDEPLTRANGESTMGNVVVDAMRAEGNADIAVSNYGGVRSEIKSGTITARDVFKVMPFDNKIVLMRVTGKFIKDLIEDRVSGNSNGMLVSGAKIVADKNLPDRERVTLLEIGGKAYDPDATYSLSVSDYLAEGNSGFHRLTEVSQENTAQTGIAIRDAIINYVKAQTPLKPKLEGRFKIIKKNM